MRLQGTSAPRFDWLISTHLNSTTINPGRNATVVAASKSVGVGVAGTLLVGRFFDGAGIYHLPYMQ